MTVSPASKPALDPLRLAAEVRAELTSPAYKPPMLPTVATELLRMSHRAEVPIAEVVKVLERDPVLAARVLLIAQSAQYAGRSPVTSLRQAAVRLGIASLRDVAVEAALQLKLLRVPGYAWLTQRMAQHGTVAAHVTRSVCRRAQLPQEHAFLIGLLHDAGMAAVLMLLTERSAVDGQSFERLAPVLDALHPEASALLVRTWEISGPVEAVVAGHHKLDAEGDLLDLEAALAVAGQLCWEAGAGILPPPPVQPEPGELPEQPKGGLDTSPPGVIEAAVEVLALDEKEIVALRAETAEVVAGLKAA